VRDDLVVVDFDDELVVGKVGGDISDVHHLNPSATLVFRLCDGTGTMDDVAAEIAETYELPLDDVLRDVRTLVRQFRQRGLLTAKPVVRRRREPDPEAGDEHEHQHGEDDQHSHASNGHDDADERELIQEQEPAHD
jgi:hypothetical protein